MAKLFFEVFPTLKITGEMSALLKETEITKVASNSAQNALRIYLESTRLIPKPEIYHIEQEIRQQLFPHKEVAVKIIEKFNLSSQYTPEKLMAVYRESILEEIRNYSVLLYNLMRCSKMEFDREDHMILTLEDTIVATERSNELIDILEKIICERCGLKLMIEPQYEKPAENNYLKSADSQIETEVAHIVARTAAARTQNTDGMEQPAIKEAEVQRNAEAAKTEKVPAVPEKIRPPVQKAQEQCLLLERITFPAERISRENLPSREEILLKNQTIRMLFMAVILKRMQFRLRPS